MAPKKRKKASSGTALVLKSPAEMTLAGEFNKQDMCTVEVAKIERVLRAGKKKFTQDINALDKDIAVGHKQVSDEAKEQGKKISVTDVKSVLSALKAAGFKGCKHKVKTEFLSGTSHPDGSEHKPPRILHKVSVSQGERGEYYDNYQVSREKEVPLKGKGLTLYRKVEKMESDRRDLKEKLSNVLIQLQDMDSLERQARATATEAMMAQDDQGKAILAQQDATVQKICKEYDIPVDYV